MYQEILLKEANARDLIYLRPNRGGNNEYTLGPYYKIPNRSLAFPYNGYADLLLIEHQEVDLSMWFDSTKPLVTWLSIKDKFIKWIDKV